MNEHTFDSQGQDEVRRRGLELQAALPPRRTGAWARLRRRKGRSEGMELAAGTADLGVELGLWGLLLAVPGVIIWLIRRLRSR